MVSGREIGKLVFVWPLAGNSAAAAADLTLFITFLCPSGATVVGEKEGEKRPKMAQNTGFGQKWARPRPSENEMKCGPLGPVVFHSLSSL